MKSYYVVTGRSCAELEKNVNEELKSNSELVGGVSVSSSGNLQFFSQAVLKNSENYLKE
jgi:hypothetical protein